MVSYSSSTIMAIKGLLMLVSYCSSTILNATQVALCSEISPSYLVIFLSLWYARMLSWLAWF